ncbi:MAG: TolC family protein [Acidobacteria bacterium]|nr:TolC family protein [Acidobacteriota bacterium]
MRLLLLAAFAALSLSAQSPAAPSAAPSQAGGPAAQATSQPAPQADYFDEKKLPASDVIDVPWFPSRSWLNRVWKPEIPRYELKAPARLQDHVVNGKLELTLKNYMDLVLANNTDIEITRLNVQTPRNAITRASGIFDPTFLTRFSATRANNPASDILAGASTVSSLNQPWTMQYQQLLSTGTTVTGNFNGARNSTNSQFQTFNPSYQTGMNLNFSQPLLRGRGRDIVKLPISVARSRLRASYFTTADAILDLVQGAETAYWNVIEARESLRVQEKAFELADISLKRAQREFELGATSELDIFQPKAQYANAEIFVTQARYRLAQAEDILRRQMGVDLDPNVRNLPISLTEAITIPEENQTFDRESLVEVALRVRPDLRAVRQNLDIDELNIRSSRNALLPNVALGGGYTTSGRGGTFYPRQLVGGGTVVPVPGGIGDAFDQMFGFGFPTYNFSLTFQFPVRDRRAAADLADAAVQRKRDTLQLRTTMQTARLEVLQAINNVENSRASLKLAVIARDLAQKRQDAEQKKYDLGTSTIFFVLAAQTDLTQAESNLVTQTVNYRRNLIVLRHRTGELLTDRGIVVQ